MSEVVTGGCSCGAVRFEVTMPAKWCANCHCSMCRRAHSAAFVTWAGFDEASFRVIAGQEKISRYASSPGARRTFCSSCGSPLTFEAERWQGEVHVARACLPDELALAPKVHAFWSDRASWLPEHDDLPRRGGRTGVEPL